MEEKSLAQQETERIELELKGLQLEKQQLELETLREAVRKQRQKKAEKEILKVQTELDLAKNKELEEAILKGCNHRKGGRDMAAAMKQGDDGGNYSVIKHSLGFGNVLVLCTRCTAEWQKGDTKKTHPSGFSWEEAMAWPSDNVMSTAVSFGIQTQGATDRIRQLEAQLAEAQRKQKAA